MTVGGARDDSHRRNAKKNRPDSVPDRDRQDGANAHRRTVGPGKTWRPQAFGFSSVDRMRIRSLHPESVHVGCD